MTAALSPAQQEGLQEIARLMEAHNLSPSDIKKIRKKETGKGYSKGELILRLFAYLGGTLIFVGLGIFTQTIWNDIGSLPRVIITFGSGFTAYLCALFFSFDARLSKVATPAFLVAFLLQPVGLFVLLKEYFPGDNAALGSMIVFGLLAIQQALTFSKFRLPSLLLYSLLYFIGFIGGFVEYFDFDRGFASLLFGIFLLGVTIDMQRRNNFKDLTPIFFFIGMALFFSGLYYYIGRTPFDPIALSFILALLGFAVIKDNKTLYVLSLLYMTAYFCGGPGGGWRAGWTHYNELAALFTGSSLVLAGQWLKKSAYISLYPVWMFVGTAYALGGAYSMLRETPIEPLYIIPAVACAYASLLIRSRAVLAASILCLIGFIIDFSARYFANTVGWPLLLIFIGFAVLASGLLFSRLAGRIKNAAP
ncbi:MAG: hypothetical protein WBK77_09885 [Alphaproteobacteria bacterium]